MRYLKFSLLGTVLCAMVFSTGYSSDSNQFKEKEFQTEKSDKTDVLKKQLNRIENTIKQYSDYSKIRKHIENKKTKSVKGFFEYDNISIEDCELIYDLLISNPKLIKEFPYICTVIKRTYDYYNNTLKTCSKLALKYSDEQLRNIIRNKKMILASKKYKNIQLFLNKQCSEENKKVIDRQHETDDEFLSRIDNAINESTSFDDPGNNKTNYYFSAFFENYLDISLEDCKKIYSILRENPELIIKYHNIVEVFKKLFNNTMKIKRSEAYDIDEYVIMRVNIDSIEKLNKLIISKSSKADGNLTSEIEKNKEDGNIIIMNEKIRTTQEEKINDKQEINTLNNKLYESKVNRNQINEIKKEDEEKDNEQQISREQKVFFTGESSIQDSDEEFLNGINGIISAHTKFIADEKTGNIQYLPTDINKDRLYQLIKTKPKLVHSCEHVHGALKREYEGIKEDIMNNPEYKEQFETLKKYFEICKKSDYFNEDSEDSEDSEDNITSVVKSQIQESDEKLTRRVEKFLNDVKNKNCRIWNGNIMGISKSTGEPISIKYEEKERYNKIMEKRNLIKKIKEIREQTDEELIEKVEKFKEKEKDQNLSYDENAFEEFLGNGDEKISITKYELARYDRIMERNKEENKKQLFYKEKFKEKFNEIENKIKLNKGLKTFFTCDYLTVEDCEIIYDTMINNPKLIGEKSSIYKTLKSSLEMCEKYNMNSIGNFILKTSNSTLRKYGFKEKIILFFKKYNDICSFLKIKSPEKTESTVIDRQNETDEDFLLRIDNSIKKRIEFYEQTQWRSFMTYPQLLKKGQEFRNDIFFGNCIGVSENDCHKIYSLIQSNPKLVIKYSNIVRNLKYLYNELERKWDFITYSDVYYESELLDILERKDAIIAINKLIQENN